MTHEVALYDLYDQANNTDRFGPRKDYSSPQERLVAWEKELRNQIRSAYKAKQLEQEQRLATKPKLPLA